MITKTETMREKILKLLENENDPESKLIKFMELAEKMMPAAVFGGFTFRSHANNLQEIYDTCKTLLEEIRKNKS